MNPISADNIVSSLYDQLVNDISARVYTLMSEDGHTIVDLHQLASHIDIEDLSQHISVSEIAEHISAAEVAEWLDVSDVADNISLSGYQITIS